MPMEHMLEQLQQENEALVNIEKIERLQQIKDSEIAEPEEPRIQFVIIAFNTQYYGIQIFSAREILKVPKITWLPCSPDFIAGVISVRGNIHSIVNLKTFLRLGDSHITEQSRIILVESGELMTGLLVDEMVDILDVPESAILPVTDPNLNVTPGYIAGKLHWEEKTVTLLNVDAITQGVVV